MKKEKIKHWSRVLQKDLETLSFELKKSINAPALIILEGPMGAGKTTFAKTFSQDLSSPTYSVLTEVEDVLHGDFYRLENSDEIVHLELPLYLEDKNYFLLEWGSKFFNTVARELEEDFSTYLLEIEINEGQDSRNFELFEIS